MDIFRNNLKILHILLIMNHEFLSTQWKDFTIGLEGWERIELGMSDRRSESLRLNVEADTSNDKSHNVVSPEDPR